VAHVKLESGIARAPLATRPGLTEDAAGPRPMHRTPLSVAAAVLAATGALAGAAPEVRERRQIAAPEARQAVAVDATHVYAVDSAAIGKYDKLTGVRVAGWTGPEAGPIRHLNSGVVVERSLHCAHSNYPDVPPASSIEIFETATLAHRGSHSFGITSGWATWVDRHADAWWVVFAYYDKDGPARLAGRDARWTTLVRYDDGWRSTGAWLFPAAVVERFDGYSNSGGSWGANGRLYATGHDRPEVYVLRLPVAGSTLELERVLAVPMRGQGVAWDRSPAGLLWGIDRQTRRALGVEIDAPDAASAAAPSGTPVDGRRDLP
jgi:hypothetical protein